MRCSLIKFINCLVYLAILGLVSQAVGMSLPRKAFNPKRVPYRSYAWEKDGRIYEKIKIKKWKTKVPDVSRVVRSMLPKKIDSRPKSAQAEQMAKETCVAESVHVFLSVLGFGCIFVWRGVGGITVSVLYALGNVPFILIQRYNRPRQLELASLLKLQETKNANNGGSYESAQ